MAKMNVAFAVNDGYVEHLSITIYSIVRNNPTDNFTFYVLCESLTSESKEQLNNIILLTPNVDIEVVELQDKQYGFSKLAIPKNLSFITKEMYYRYALPEVLESVDKILYLDADLIALGEIKDLYNEDIDSYYAAGVLDAGIVPRFPEHLPGLGMSNSDVYVNSGVLLMNLSKMRKKNITKKLLMNTKKIEKKLLFPDQDVLNLTLKGFIKPVKCIYNFTDQNMLENTVSIDKVKIVHFTGGIKPWHNIDQEHTKTYIARYRQYEDAYYELVLKARQPLISVIIPVHNIFDEHLVECLDSVKEQTYKNIEVVIVDDGSRATTANLLDAYAKDIKNWQVIHQENSGVNMARKNGFEKSNGDFVTFLDSDDMLVSTFCERLLTSAIKTHADIVIAEKHDFSSDAPSHPIEKENQADDIIANQVEIIRANRSVPFSIDSFLMTIWGALYKKEIIDQIDWDFANYTIAEDEFWTIQTKILAKKITYVHQQVYRYRVNLKSRSKRVTPMYFKVDGVKREIPYIALGLEIFVKHSELFEKHKVVLPEELLLYSLSVTKGLILKCYEANMLDDKNSNLAKNSAAVFLQFIEKQRLQIEEGVLIELELIKANPELFIHYLKRLNESQSEIDRLANEALVRTKELDTLRQPGIKLAARKLTGSIKRRMRTGFVKTS